MIADTHLVHPLAEGLLPGVLLLQVQVGVEEDQVHVALQVLQTPQQQLMAFLLRFATLDLQGCEQERPVKSLGLDLICPTLLESSPWKQKQKQ